MSFSRSQSLFDCEVEFIWRLEMRTRQLSFAVLFAAVLASLVSQVGAAAHAGQVISPEVHPDRRVTFRLHAPRADRVEVNVQFAEGVQPMSKDNDGLWSITLGPAEPDIYVYSFIVDGLEITDPVNPVIKFWRTSKNLVEVPGERPMFFQEQRVGHGVVHIHKYESRSLGVTRSLYVYTPPGYETSQNVRFPVLYLLHGMGDNEDAWTVVGRANIIVDNLLAASKARPLVIVMPYGHTPSAPPDSQSLDNYREFEKDLIEDVIPYIQERYRVSSDRKDRAIAGLSMGGGQALTVGLGNLELFGWVGAFSSAVPKGRKLDNLLDKLNVTNARLELLWVGCGRKDFLFDANEKFLEVLKAKKVRHVARITDGAHDWRVWRRYLNEFVPLLYKTDE